MFHPDLTIHISDIVNAALLIIAVIGIYLTIRQLRQSYEVQKATFYKELYLTLFGDPDIRDAFYLIERNMFTFDEKNLIDFRNTWEKKIDRLLSFADLICGLYARKMLTKPEMKSFEYQLRKIRNNRGIQAYITYLESVFKTRKTPTTPFPNFIAYFQEDQQKAQLSQEQSNPSQETKSH